LFVAHPDCDSEGLLAPIGIDCHLVLVFLFEELLVEERGYIHCADIPRATELCKKVRLKGDLVAVWNGDTVEASNIHNGPRLGDVATRLVWIRDLLVNHKDREGKRRWMYRTIELISSAKLTEVVVDDILIALSDWVGLRRR
jgi:hypothetical protein